MCLGYTGAAGAGKPAGSGTARPRGSSERGEYLVERRVIGRFGVDVLVEKPGPGAITNVAPSCVTRLPARWMR